MSHTFTRCAWYVLMALTVAAGSERAMAQAGVPKADTSALGSPSAPAGAPAASLQAYLRSWNIRYVVLETQGRWMKTVDMLRQQLLSRAKVDKKNAVYTIYARQTLAALAEQNRVVFRDERYTVFEIGDRSLNPTNR